MYLFSVEKRRQRGNFLRSSAIQWVVLAVTNCNKENSNNIEGIQKFHQESLNIRTDLSRVGSLTLEILKAYFEKVLSSC